MFSTLLWSLGAYLLLGVATTVILSNTPYSENSWIKTTLLWPLFLYALLFG